MTRGLLINGIHTYNQWGLILVKNNIGLPQPKFNYIDLPSSDGSIDLTEALKGDVPYHDRQGSFEFDLLNKWTERPNLIEQISSHIQGHKVLIYLPDDTNWYYKGRLTIQSFEKNKTVGKLIVESRCEPWKYKKDPTIKNLTIGSSGNISTNCFNARKPVIPIITTSSTVSIGWKGNTYVVNQGSRKMTNIIFTEGDNPISFSGSQGTTITIEYQEGAI